MDDSAPAGMQSLPFWKRPSVWWVVVFAPLELLLLTSVVAANVELFTNIVCRVHNSGNVGVVAPPVGGIPYDAAAYSPWLNATGTQANLGYGGAPQPTFSSCATDPVVQAAVAKLTTVLATTAGVLSFLTVGWWGSLSDRLGRTTVIRVYILGQFLPLLNTILVVNFVDVLPGGYWFLLLDSVVLGLFGGIATFTAALNAYMSDISTPETRSSNFSLGMGSLLLGMGIGPLAGSFVVRISGNVLNLYYAALAFRLLVFCFSFAIPDSLSAEKKHLAAVKHREELDVLGANRPHSRLKDILFFLEPLLILWPNPVPGITAQRQWGLLILAMAQGIFGLLAVSDLHLDRSQLITANKSAMMPQLLYALMTFDWDAEYVGYCLSSIGFARAIYLIGILPSIVKFAKNRHASKIREMEREPLLHPGKLVPSAAAVDMQLARASALVEIFICAMLPWAPSGVIFIAILSFGCLGSGFGPAIHSVALELFSHKVGKETAAVESGKLFGALGVGQALFGTLIGPPLYGFVYAATVATFPATIFYLSLVFVTISFILLHLIRLPRVVTDPSEDEV
ncbi:unnamed protein product [Mycena citricolor]|uniref:Major facilitator superfamily (MFS) profile domain-containing protein n=1 Tax=Mycena citricolor TaxID=2018698 RepID=A0AAD2HBD4_9AGAR|nr:unnamed protein product [Mycena citricolor]